MRERPRPSEVQLAQTHHLLSAKASCWCPQAESVTRSAVFNRNPNYLQRFSIQSSSRKNPDFQVFSVAMMGIALPTGLWVHRLAVHRTTTPSTDLVAPDLR